MRITVIGTAAALACLAAHPAGADIEFTDAISRQVLLVNTYTVECTDAISRQVLMVNLRPVDNTDAISRQVLLVNVNTGVEYPDANSRQVLLYLPPYTTPEVRKALSIAAGLLAATPANMDRLNIIRDGDSATKVDMRDAARIARMAMGLDP